MGGERREFIAFYDRKENSLGFKIDLPDGQDDISIKIGQISEREKSFDALIKLQRLYDYFTQSKGHEKATLSDFTQYFAKLLGWKATNKHAIPVAAVHFLDFIDSVLQFSIMTSTNPSKSIKYKRAKILKRICPKTCSKDEDFKNTLLEFLRKIEKEQRQLEKLILTGIPFEICMEPNSRVRVVFPGSSIKLEFSPNFEHFTASCNSYKYTYAPQFEMLIKYLWKVLHDQKKISERTLFLLASNMIKYFDQIDNRMIRNFHYFSYLRLCRQRYNFALAQKSDAWIKEAGIYWFNLLTNDSETRIDEYLVREEELWAAMRQKHVPVKAGAVPFHFFLIEAERTNHSIQTIAVWFLRRFNLEVGYKIIWGLKNFSKASYLGNGSDRSDRPQNSSNKYRLKKIVADHRFFLKLLMATIFLIAIWPIQAVYGTKLPTYVLFITVVLSISGLLYHIMGFLRYNINAFVLFFPRLFLGILVGWSFLLSASELWAIALLMPMIKSVLIILLVSLIVLLFIYTGIIKRINISYKPIQRMFNIFFLGLIESFLVGFFLTSFLGSEIIELSDILSVQKVTAYYDYNNTVSTPDLNRFEEELNEYRFSTADQKSPLDPDEKLRIDVLEKMTVHQFPGTVNLLYKLSIIFFNFSVFPTLLFNMTLTSLFIGIILQLAWEDKSLSESL